jgi:hypothetical protein
MADTPAHNQTVTHTYHLHYPQHAPRAEDPHYALFNAYHKAHAATAVCSIGALGPRFLVECKGGMELHHRIVEFAMQNGIELDVFIRDVYLPLHPDMKAGFTQDDLMAWAESDENFEWLCAYHHRGRSGVHVISSSDWNGVRLIPGLAY